jgi:lipopolysaccharide assembly outer membrane protein LptD (OstA)
MNNLNIKDIQNNVVKDISYKKMYNLTGDEFVIKGAYGEFIEENNDIIMITDVKAFVNKNDGTSVYIKSDKAIYDTVNNETNFTNNVELIYLDHKINVDFLDLFFSNNLIQAYGNLIYQNLEYKLLADKLELDIITKNIKIFMLDNSNVKIKRY